MYVPFHVVAREELSRGVARVDDHEATDRDAGLAGVVQGLFFMCVCVCV